MNGDIIDYDDVALLLEGDVIDYTEYVVCAHAAHTGSVPVYQYSGVLQYSEYHIQYQV